MYINLGLCVRARPCVHERTAPHIPTSLNMSRLENGRMQKKKMNMLISMWLMNKSPKKRKKKLKVPYDPRLTLQLFSADNNVPGVHPVHCSLSEDMEAANTSISFRTINHVRRLHWSPGCSGSGNRYRTIPLRN